MKNILLLAATAAHLVNALHRRGHEAHCRVDIAAHQGHFALEQIRPQRGPVTARFALWQGAQPCQLLLGFVGFPSPRQGQANPVVHPDGQVVGELERLFTFRSQGLPHR